jgi:hypothetical protein
MFERPPSAAWRTGAGAKLSSPRSRRAEGVPRTFTYKANLPDILILNRQIGKFACFQYTI